MPIYGALRRRNFDGATNCAADRATVRRRGRAAGSIPRASFVRAAAAGAKPCTGGSAMPNVMRHFARTGTFADPGVVVESSYRFVIADDHPLFRGALREAVSGLFSDAA